MVPARRLESAVAQTEAHARRDHLAPGQHHTCSVPCRWNPATRDGGGVPAAPLPALPRPSPPCLAKGASAEGRGAVGHFPTHALHPWGLTCKEMTPFFPFFFFSPPFLPSPDPACCCCRYLWACLSDLGGAYSYLRSSKGRVTLDSSVDSMEPNKIPI